MGNPALEGSRFGLAAAEDKGIQAGFADEARYLLSPVGVTNNDPRFFIVIQFCDCLTAIPQPQRPAHIRRNKPRLTLQRFFDRLPHSKNKKQESAFPVCKDFGEGGGVWKYPRAEVYESG